MTSRSVVASVVVLLAAACGSHHHGTAQSNPTPSVPAGATTTTIARSARSAVAPKTPNTRSSASAPTTYPTVPLAGPFTSDQLATALLQPADLPAGSQRTGVAPNGWGGVCGSSPPPSAAPVSAAAVVYDGNHGLQVREDLADFTSAGGYLDAVRVKISCATYTLDGAPNAPVKVTPIPPAVLASGIDSNAGASGVGVETVDPQGRVTFHVWIRQRGLVIALVDRATTATPVSAVQLAQLALERVTTALA
jgi:hypothetical protein